MLKYFSSLSKTPIHPIFYSLNQEVKALNTFSTSNSQLSHFSNKLRIEKKNGMLNTRNEASIYRLQFPLFFNFFDSIVQELMDTKGKLVDVKNHIDNVFQFLNRDIRNIRFISKVTSMQYFNCF